MTSSTHFALFLYLLHVSWDPRVQEQVEPGLVELLGGLHSDEDVIRSDVLGWRRVSGGRRGARGLLHLPPSPGQFGEVRRESPLRLRAPGLCVLLLSPRGILEQGARPGVLTASLLIHLDPVMLHSHQEQQQAETRCAGYRDGRLLSIIFHHD